MFDQITTTTEQVDLVAGDVVLLDTDRVTDLPPPYGISSADLTGLVHDLRNLPTVDEIADAIHRSILDRSLDRSRRDDIALLVIRVRTLR